MGWERGCKMIEGLGPHETRCSLDNDYWSVATLILASEIEMLGIKTVDPEVFNISEDYWGDMSTTAAFIEHIKRVKDCDLVHPIILSPDGRIMDGVHRICKALIEGKQIRYVRFKKLPPADGQIE